MPRLYAGDDGVALAQMDATELQINFRQAKDQREQIKILADLNCCSPKFMAEWLQELGALDGTGILPSEFSSKYDSVQHDVSWKKYDKRFSGEVCERLYREGLSDAAIADRLGVAEYRISRYRSAHGLRRPPIWRQYQSDKIKKEALKPMKKETETAKAPQKPAPVAQAEREERGVMTVGGFVDWISRLLSPALVESELSIDGRPIYDIYGFNVDVRNNKVTVNLRTEAD